MYDSSIKLENYSILVYSNERHLSSFLHSKAPILRKFTRKHENMAYIHNSIAFLKGSCFILSVSRV